MEILYATAFIDSIPSWAPIVGLIALLVIFGDKILWEYEVDFAYQKDYGSGEIEIECKKNKGVELELEFDLEQQALHKEISVFLKGEMIHLIAAAQNNRKSLKIQENIQLTEPQVGDLVEVHFDQKAVFSGKLIRD